MLRSRSAAGRGGRAHLLLRVHLLPRVRRDRAPRPLPQLRRRAGAPAPPARGQAREVPALDGPRAQARGLPELTPLPRQIATSPRRMPIVTASVRLPAPSLDRIEATWNFAVWVEMPSLEAMALLPSPSASMPSTSTSRPVRGCAGSGL